jgi:MFS transporter, ACS family, hexuronate transporter
MKRLDSEAVSTKNVGRFRWVVVGTLFCLTTINYMDRFLIGVLKPTIVHDLRWTETDYANVIFCFQLAYAVGLITVSRIVDRLGVRRGLALVVSICAVAAASHCLVGSVLGFCAARFALGFGESGTWPGCVKAIGEWLPRRERALGNGLINAGSSVGATVTPLVVPLILKFVSWHLTFIYIAGLDVLWLVVWLIGYRAPDDQPRLTRAELAYIRSDPNPPQGELSWWRLFQYRQTWAFLLAKGLSDPVWWFFLFWVPGFLATRYGLPGSSAAASASAMAFPIMLIYILSSVGSVAGGWIPMRLIGLGWSVNAARKTVMLGCALCVIPVFAVSHPIGLWVSVLLLGLAGAAHLGFSANLFTVATDTVPRHVSGSVTGIGGMAAAIGAMCNAKLIGFILDTTHSYAIPFAIASVSYLVALGLLQLLLPNLEPMKMEVDQ